MTISSTAPAVGGTDAMADARLGALDRIAELGPPTRRDEAWRYAPHRQLGELTFGPSPESGPSLSVDLDSVVPTLSGPRIVVVNGAVDRDRSKLASIDGIRISTLGDALAERPERVAPHFELGDVDDVFLAANIAFGNDGAVIHIEDNVDLDIPIHIIDVAVPGDSPNGTCTGVVVHVGSQSSATVVETRVGFTDAFGGSNIRTSVTLDADATLEHIVLQDVPTEQIHLSRVDVTQGLNSTFRARSFNLGAAYGRLAYTVHLDGEGAHADLSGLFFGFGDQTLDQQLDITHAAPNCTSRQSYRGVLDDSSTGVFNGGIDVKPGADGTDAEQSNDNLLLSNRAEINTQPRLEILADEVACKHGATVGQLDDTALYYMRSRGIPADEARRLLINGFADQAVDDVGIGAVRDWITHRLGHDDV
ncbi:Fe-S cluster assembly protein SufD [Ilumatobacter nonamiensis]|uniref:Fe-S cluster assembly protein SufD n=1 Tax=Ilumatobacter nonamiensis TaxID=467093 RepID=UPI000344AC85|nr:Fe-S cluster assembly protein SufD [Ilumatobacter nonamiensis]